MSRSVNADPPRAPMSSDMIRWSLTFIVFRDRRRRLHLDLVTLTVAKRQRVTVVPFIDRVGEHRGGIQATG